MSTGWTSVRMWLLKRLIGDWTVVANATVQQYQRTPVIKARNGKQTLLRHITIEGPEWVAASGVPAITLYEYKVEDAIEHIQD